MTNPVTTPGDGSEDDDGSSDDDGSTGGSAGDTSGASTTGGPADGTTSAADSSGSSSGAPVTASESSSVGGSLEESSSGAPATTEAGDDMAEMPMEDDGPLPPPDPWESCAMADCDAGSLCINFTGLRDYSPYCAPECMVDADCPYPGGDALVTCALIEEGATEPTHCAVICEYDGAVLGACPDGMQCADVPDQMTQVAVCMWP